jgi:probable HAF family extracellular repeat protein
VLRITALVLWAALLSFAQSTTPPRFTLTDIGVLPGMDTSQAQAVSSSGLVVGFSAQLGHYASTGGPVHGFLYKDGTLTDLGSVGDYPSVLPLSVNDSGQVVGFEYAAGKDSPPAAFIFQNGVMQFAFGGQGIASAINDQGQYVGLSNFVSTLGAGDQGLLGSGQTYSALENPPGQQAGAFGISAHGLVAGATLNDNDFYPVIWQDGVPTVIPLPEPFGVGWAWAINDSGEAAGFIAQIAKKESLLNAALFTSTTVTNIGALLPGESSIANGINSSGWVVGVKGAAEIGGELYCVFEPFDATQTPFLYIAGKVYDLNTLVDGATGWTLAYATGINDAGQIVGAGDLNGVQRAFLLTPEPAAPTPAISGVVGAGLSQPAVTTLSENGLFTIFGSNLAATGTARQVGAADLVNNTLPTTLAQTCVELGGTRVPVIYVSPGQINAVAASLPASGSVAVTVLTGCDSADEVATAAVNVPVASEAPEFLYFTTTKSGANPVAAVDASTNVYVGPAGLLTGLLLLPPKRATCSPFMGLGSEKQLRW